MYVCTRIQLLESKLLQAIGLGFCSASPKYMIIEYHNRVSGLPLQC